MNKIDSVVFKILAFLLFTCCFPSYVLAYDITYVQDMTQDSLRNPSVSTVKKFAESELKQNSLNFNKHLLALKQRKVFYLIKNETERARNILRQGFNYPEMRKEISQLFRYEELAAEGVIKNQDSIQTIRNLSTSSSLLNGLLNRTNDCLSQISAFHKSLGFLQFSLDSLAMDSVLYQLPQDSLKLKDYFPKLLFLTKDMKLVNEELKVALDSIQHLEFKVNTLKFDLESEISETKSLRVKLLEKFTTNEMGSLSLSLRIYRPLGEIITFSMTKDKLVLFFYVVNHQNKMILILLFIAGIYFYLVILRRKIIKNKVPEDLIDRQHVLRYPLASAILLALTIFQFFLPLPPIIVSGLIWLISAIALTVIIRRSVSRFEFNSWLFFNLLFIFAFTCNLILRPSLFERWSILFLSILGLGAAIFLLTTKKKKKIQEKIIFVPVSIMALFQVPAIFFNLTGGYSLAKILMTNGVYNVIIAFLIISAARILKNTLQISYYFHLTSEGKKRSFNDENINTQFSLSYYFLFFIGWFILLVRDFFYFQTVIDPLRDSLTATRSIGEFSFNYKSILIFFLVLFLSGMISQVVSFLATDNRSVTNNERRGGLGSWLLLIRITIITAGVLLAFVAAGIPMDRIAIILGALSVGIGFGLQALVNNLISGLVIAFEKPVNVGDIVEFAGRTGTMKSIGIRSSVITTWDGADVIIPNGDLLNQHLVNWTLGNSRRRIDLPLKIAFDTDLERTRKLLFDLMLNDQRILKNPPPIVLANKFSVSSVDIALKFWVSHFDIGQDVKSDLILSIKALFKDQGIEIPFPRQDVHML